MKKRKLQEFLKLTDGTLYYNFDVLLKKEYIEKVEIIHEESRPDKTTYRITEEGHEGLKQEIYASFKKYRKINSLYASILYLKHVDKNKACFILEENIEQSRERILLHNQLVSSLQEEMTETVHFIGTHANTLLLNELEWMDKLLEFIRKQ